jgi:hypothetical protein
MTQMQMMTRPLPAGSSGLLTSARAEALLASLAVGALFLTRPTAFGEIYTLPGMMLLAVITVAMLITAAATKSAAFTVRAPQIWFYLGFAGYMTALVVFGERPHSAANVAKGVVIEITASIFAFTMLSDRQRATSFYDTLAKLLVALSAATLITLTLLLLQFGVGQLVLGYFSYPYQLPAGTILFPGSMIYNYAPTWFGLLPRLSGGFREVGIFPAFACWAAGYGAFRGWKPLAIAICLAATVACFSSLGALLALLTLAGILAYRFRLPWWAYVIVGPAAGLAVIALTYNLPYIGIGYKYATVSTSFVERANAMGEALDTNLLLGGEPDNRNSGINLISGISIYGTAGVALILATLLPAVRQLRFFVAALSAPFITALVSQPIATEPLFVLLFLSWTVFETRRPASQLASARPISGMGDLRSTSQSRRSAM